MTADTTVGDQAIAKGDYEMALFDLVSGPSVFRLYELWHSRGAFNLGQGGSQDHPCRQSGLVVQ